MLRSISARIHWSLAVRALLFAGAWAYLPFGAFAFAALVLYSRPFFRLREFSAFLVLALALMGVIEQSAFAALFFGAVFYLLLGVKDLVFVERRAPLQILASMMLLAFGAAFFPEAACSGAMVAPSGEGGCPPGSAAFAALLLGAACFILMQSTLANLRGELPGETEAASIPAERIASGAFALISAELAWALALLPLAESAKIALFFLAAAVSADVITARFSGKLSRRFALTDASLFLVLAAAVLAASRWGVTA